MKLDLDFRIVIIRGLRFICLFDIFLFVASNLNEQHFLMKLLRFRVYKYVIARPPRLCIVELTRAALQADINVLTFAITNCM